MEEALQFIPMKEIDRCIQDFVPEQLRKNTSWTVNTWNTWAEARNTVTTFGQEIIPTVQQFGSYNPQTLDSYLCKFVMEVRNKDGNRYPKDSLHNLCAGISRFVRLVIKRPDLNFLDPKNFFFHHFQYTLRTQMKLSEDMGIKTDKKQSQPISREQETILWTKRILNMDTALGLSRAVYYYNCKVFGVRAREEHRNLRVEQYTFGIDEEGKYIAFHGCMSKYSGREHRKVRAVKHHDIDREISVYKIFAKYIQIIGCTGNFYLKPLEPNHQGSIRFSVQPLGQNTLGSYTSTMMKEAGFEGHYTGHSGIVTLAVTLYSEGISERVIKERTGLLSEYVRHFKAMSISGGNRSGSELAELPSSGNGQISSEERLHMKQELPTTASCKVKKLMVLPSLFTGQQRQANMVRLYHRKNMQNKDISRIIDVPELTAPNPRPQMSDLRYNYHGNHGVCQYEPENKHGNVTRSENDATKENTQQSFLSQQPCQSNETLDTPKTMVDYNSNYIEAADENQSLCQTGSENSPSEAFLHARPSHKRKPSIPQRIVGNCNFQHRNEFMETCKKMKKEKYGDNECLSCGGNLGLCNLEDKYIQTYACEFVSTATQTDAPSDHIHKKLQYKVYHGIS